MSIASVTTRGYQPGGGTLPLTITLGYALNASAPPPPPPPVVTAQRRGAPIWWRRREEAEEEEEETVNEIGIVDTVDLVTEPEALARSTPLREVLPPPETNYAGVPDAARARVTQEIAKELKQERKRRLAEEARLAQIREDEDILLLT